MTRIVHVPGDKSLTHRALLLSALADGRSRIRRPLVGADTRSTAHALRLLGCDIPEPGADAELVIDGRGLHGLTAPAGTIDCGNSGTTARLLMGVLAGYPFASKLTGDASLRSRPMRRVTAPLAAMGARFDELGAADRLPVRVRGGALRPLDYHSPHASAQVKSAILLAGLTGGVRVAVSEPTLSRDHTERMLGHLGVKLQRKGTTGTPSRVALAPPDRVGPLDFDVPGDFSSAAFVIAFVLLHGNRPLRIEGVGLNPGRTGLLGVLQRMGARVSIEDERDSCGEPVGDIVVERTELRGTSVAAAEVPSLIDEVPVIAALAARADGRTVIEGAADLRVKESDRIAAMVSNLRRVGVSAEELPDGMTIVGTDAPLQGRVDTMHDHRIAMAFGVLAGGATTPDAAGIEVGDPGVVAVSYPDFWSMLRHVRAP